MSGIKRLEKIIQQKRYYCLQQIQQYLSATDNATKPVISTEQEDKLMVAAFVLISDCFMQLTEFCLSHYPGLTNAQEFKHKLTLNQQKMAAFKSKIAESQSIQQKTELTQYVETKNEPQLNNNQQISGYLIFFKEKSKEISNVQLQSISHKVSFISNLWSNMSSEQRQLYEQKAQKIKIKRNNKNKAEKQSKDADLNILNGHHEHNKSFQNATSKSNILKNGNFHKVKANNENKTKACESKGRESSDSELQRDILSDSLQDRQKQIQQTEISISKKISKSKPKILKIMYKQH